MGTMMIAIEALIGQPAALVVGWTLLHFMWQGTLIAALTAFVLALFRNSAADVRYVVSTVAMSLMLTVAAVTAMQLWGAAESAGLQTPSSFASIDAQSEPVLATTPAVGVPLFRIEPWLPLLALGWVCGVVVLSVRLLTGWVWVQRLKSHGAVSPGDEWQHLVARLSRRLHMTRPVRLLQSTLVDVPTVIGWLKPVVLLPVSALAGLTPQQLEGILAHELAHVRRHDYLVNLLQTVVETLLFYHPAVWWVSRRIRAERENCCDDLAVSLCGDRYSYAQALADLEELRASGHHLLLAASGGSLVQRVRRLLGAPAHPDRAPGWLAALAVVVMLGSAVGVTGGGARQSARAPGEAPAVALTSDPAEPIADRRPAEAQLAPVTQKKAQAAEVATAARAHASAGKVRSPREALPSQAEPTADQPRRPQPPASEEAAVFEAAPSRAVEPAIAAVIAERYAHAFQLNAAAIPQLAMASASVHAGEFAGISESRGHFSWSNNGERLDVKYNGYVEFTDDDADVKRLSPGGSLTITESGSGGARTIEFTADRSGNLTRRFWVGTSEQPFDREGRQWLASALRRFIRHYPRRGAS